MNFINSYHVYTDKLSSEDMLFAILHLALIWGITLILAFFIQVFIHEAGHLLFGLFTGYSFLVFRMFFISIVNLNGTFSIKKYRCPGSVGQCIMLPPKKIKKPYILHVIGGVLLNLISAIILFSIAFSPLSISFIYRMVLLIFTFYGFGFSLLNGTPLRSLDISNDGSELVELIKDKLALQLYFLQLSIAHKLMLGTSYKDIPYDTFKVPISADLTNSIIGYHKILESYYFMDSGKWDMAREALDCFDLTQRHCGMIKEIVTLEKLFIDIYTGEEIKREILMKYKKTIVNGQQDFHVIRIICACDVGLQSDSCTKVYENIDDKINSYLYLGEATFCIALINKLMH